MAAWQIGWPTWRYGVLGIARCSATAACTLSICTMYRRDSGALRARIAGTTILAGSAQGRGTYLRWFTTVLGRGMGKGASVNDQRIKGKEGATHGCDTSDLPCTELNEPWQDFHVLYYVIKVVLPLNLAWFQFRLALACQGHTLSDTP